MPTSFNRFIQTNTVLFSFFPKNILLNYAEFNVMHYQANYFSTYNIPLPKSVMNSVDKRQAEFFAGRYMALLTFKQLNIPCNEIAIGKHRAPIFPNNTVASITHTNTTAICAASLSKNHQFLGIDLEDVMSINTVNEVKNTVIFNNEINILMQCSLSFEKAFTLVFSAKESLFKALYPQVGYYFDFSAAKLIAISTKDNSFTLALTTDLTSNLTTGITFCGYFEELNTQIITLIAK